MNLEELTLLIEKHYVAEDGLFCLTKDETRDPFPGYTKKTVWNQNGILFLAYYYFLLEEFKAMRPEFIVRAKDTINSLKVMDGLFSRNPGGDIPEGLDNYTAICALSGRYDFKFAEEICLYGLHYGYTFDNLSPKHFTVKRWRQGSDVAFYKVSAGFMPALWEWLWWFGSMITVSFQPKKYTSEHLMAWLQLKTMEIKLPKMYEEGHWLRSLYGFTKTLFISRLRKKTKTGINEIFIDYFGADHPLSHLSTDVYF